jgi:hypothetical protein
MNEFPLDIPATPVRVLETPDGRAALCQADIVWGRDTATDETSLWFGKEAMRRIAESGVPERLRAVLFALDFATDDPERLAAALAVLKGSCDYAGLDAEAPAAGPSEQVRVHDWETGRTTTIPAAELAPGMVRARVEGLGEVWVDAAASAGQAPLRHPPFGPDVRQRLEALRETFADVWPRTLEEWEDGFRRDTHPEQEIALWSLMAGCYRHFTDGRNLSAEQKQDIFRVIVTTVNNGEDYVTRTVEAQSLSRQKVREIAAFVVEAMRSAATQEAQGAE